VTGLVAALAFLQSMVMGVLVLLGTQELGLSHVAYGAFFAVGAAGGVAGGLLACRVRIALGTASSLTGAAVLAAGGYLLMATAPNAGVAALGFAIESFAVACGNVTTLSLRQSLVPDELRGRVGNVFRMCIWGGVPLGILTGGLIASGFGVRTPILVAGLVQLALAYKTARVLRERLWSAERAEVVIDLTGAITEGAAPASV
jgi:MFS family permease